MDSYRVSFSTVNGSRGLFSSMHDTERACAAALRVQLRLEAFMLDDKMDVPFNHQGPHIAVCRCPRGLAMFWKLG